MRLILFGARGDLASRHVFPALAHLHEARSLPPGLQIVAVDRGDLDEAALRRGIGDALARHALNLDADARTAFLSLVGFRRADATNPAQVTAAVEPSQGPYVAYLALPPATFIPAVRALEQAGVPPGSRIIVEKPFGEGLASARELNTLLGRLFGEARTFRMDHFLGKQTVQNILGLRFANRTFEPLWNRQHVAEVRIVWDETLALEGRAGYYDRAGALRDMVQNHLLQLVCLVGMEPPIALDERSLRDRKVDVLRAIHRLTPEEVARRAVRARYGTGRIGDRTVPAYVDEKGIDPRRNTETFVQLTLTIENWRWAGVPFVLRTGKALGQDRREIGIRFHPVPHLAFGQESHPASNVLLLTLDPDRLALAVNINGPGDPFTLERVSLETTLAEQEPDAYGRLLLDALEGDPTFSIRGDEAEEAWRIVEPVLEAWAGGGVPLLEYPAGSDGPLQETPEN